MTDWYISSVSWAAIAQFTASHAYTVGNIIRPLTTPAAGREYAYRCTTAGTSSTEPTWSSAYTNNATITSGGATFTNVSGQSTYGWSAAAGTVQALVTTAAYRPNPGDRVFVSSDSSDSFSGALNYGNGINNGNIAFGVVQFISVNRAGSVPPVAGDIASGAAITVTSTLTLDAMCNLFWQGFTFTSGAGTNITINSSGNKSHYFKNCAFVLGGSGKLTSSNANKITLDNTTVQFGNVAGYIGCQLAASVFELTWLNTASAIQGATVPTSLFNVGNLGGNQITCRGVDLSAVTTTLFTGGAANLSQSKGLLDSCRIAAGAIRANVSLTGDEIELVNCYDGTNTLNERYTPAGNVTTDRSTYLSGGAQDDISNYSLKPVSNSQSDKFTGPLDCFSFDLENTVTGVSKTATVEVVSLGSLNNDDISLLLEYMGTLGSSIASFVNSLPTVLTASAALPTSASTWNNPPALSNTWNPADFNNATFSNANLTVTSGGANSGARGTVPYSSGKYYWEYTFVTGTTPIAGICTASAVMSTVWSTGTQAAQVLKSTGGLYVNGANVATLGAISNGGIAGVALDVPNALIWFRIAPSGNWNNSGTANPATGVGGLSISALTGALYVLFGSGTSSDQITLNSGGTSFTGAVPSGFTSGLPGLTAVKQLLQLSFTPQVAGRVRGLVRLGKPSTTVWVNSQIAIS
jgi:hypothetical protein